MERQKLGSGEGLENLLRSEFERCKALFLAMGFDSVSDVKLELIKEGLSTKGLASLDERWVGIVLPRFSEERADLFDIARTIGHELGHIVLRDRSGRADFEEGIAELIGSYAASRLSGNERPSKEDIVEGLTYYATDYENAEDARAQCLAVEKALYFDGRGVDEFIRVLMERPETAAPFYKKPRMSECSLLRHVAPGASSIVF